MKRFGTDGIRGRWGSEALNPEVARALGAVLAQQFDGPVPIVRDTRESSPEVVRALGEGLGSRGVDYGVLPTPALSAILAQQPASVGVAVTASHNPWQDNGLKVLGQGGFKLHPDDEERIDQALAGALNEPVLGGKLQRSEDGLSIYIAAQRRVLGDLGALKSARIAVDMANGAGFESAKRLLEACGIAAVFLGDRPDGRNINAGVGALHPEALQELVRREACDAGIALDGDADRCTLVDRHGDVVHGDALLLLLAQGPGLVGTVMCNSALERALKERGMDFVRSAVGDRNVQIAMAERGWRVGGEPSGHVLMSDALPTGDGLLTGLLALSGGLDLRGRLSGFEPFPDAQAAIRVPNKPPLEGLESIQALQQQAKTDLEGRVLLRYSGTEPKLRILVEASTEEEAMDWCQRFVAAAELEFS